MWTASSRARSISHRKTRRLFRWIGLQQAAGFISGIKLSVCSEKILKKAMKGIAVVVGPARNSSLRGGENRHAQLASQAAQLTIEISSKLDAGQPFETHPGPIRGPALHPERRSRRQRW